MADCLLVEPWGRHVVSGDDINARSGAQSVGKEGKQRDDEKDGLRHDGREEREERSGSGRGLRCWRVRACVERGINSCVHDGTCSFCAGWRRLWTCPRGACRYWAVLIGPVKLSWRLSYLSHVTVPRQELPKCVMRMKAEMDVDNYDDVIHIADRRYRQ